MREQRPEPNELVASLDFTYSEQPTPDEARWVLDNYSYYQGLHGTSEARLLEWVAWAIREDAIDYTEIGVTPEEFDGLLYHEAEVRLEKARVDPRVTVDETIFEGGIGLRRIIDENRLSLERLGTTEDEIESLTLTTKQDEARWVLAQCRQSLPSYENLLLGYERYKSFLPDLEDILSEFSAYVGFTEPDFFVSSRSDYTSVQVRKWDKLGSPDPVSLEGLGTSEEEILGLYEKVRLSEIKNIISDLDETSDSPGIYTVGNLLNLLHGRMLVSFATEIDEIDESVYGELDYDYLETTPEDLKDLVKRELGKKALDWLDVSRGMVVRPNPEIAHHFMSLGELSAQDIGLSEQQLKEYVSEATRHIVNVMREKRRRQGTLPLDMSTSCIEFAQRVFGVTLEEIGISEKELAELESIDNSSNASSDTW